MAGQLQNPGVHTPGGQAVPFLQLHCGCKREERLGLEAVTGERQQEPARRSLGGQGLRLLIGEQAQIRRMESQCANDLFDWVVTEVDIIEED